MYLQQQIEELEPLRAQMVLLSEQCEQRILDLREQERAEITALKQERQHLQQVIESMKEQQRFLQTQVGHFGGQTSPTQNTTCFQITLMMWNQTQCSDSWNQGSPIISLEQNWLMSLLYNKYETIKRFSFFFCEEIEIAF